MWPAVCLDPGITSKCLEEIFPLHALNAPEDHWVAEDLPRFFERE
jgi:hypothetical protein